MEAQPHGPSKAKSRGALRQAERVGGILYAYQFSDARYDVDVYESEGGGAPGVASGFQLIAMASPAARAFAYAAWN